MRQSKFEKRREKLQQTYEKALQQLATEEKREIDRIVKPVAEKIATLMQEVVASTLADNLDLLKVFSFKKREMRISCQEFVDQHFKVNAESEQEETAETRPVEKMPTSNSSVP